MSRRVESSRVSSNRDGSAIAAVPWTTAGWLLDREACSCIRLPPAFLCLRCAFDGLPAPPVARGRHHYDDDYRGHDTHQHHSHYHPPVRRASAWQRPHCNPVSQAAMIPSDDRRTNPGNQDPAIPQPLQLSCRVRRKSTRPASLVTALGQPWPLLPSCTWASSPPPVDCPGSRLLRVHATATAPALVLPATLLRVPAWWRAGGSRHEGRQAPFLVRDCRCTWFAGLLEVCSAVFRFADAMVVFSSCAAMRQACLSMCPCRLLRALYQAQAALPPCGVGTSRIIVLCRLC